jgi:ABC-2 type transport system permease protein
MNKLLLVIERDVRLFFQYKVMVIMRAIWFISQILLFGLIASRMVAIPNQTLTTGTTFVQPNQTQYFDINVSSKVNSILINASSTQGEGEVQVYFPNGTLASSGHFNPAGGNYSLQFGFDAPAAGIWAVKLQSSGESDTFSLAAYTVLDYFRYYVAGLSIMTLYSAAMFIGFDLYEEAEHGVFEYLLSLPVSRKQLVIGRSIGGGLRAFIYVGPLIAVSLYVIGSLNPLAFLVSLIALFLFAFGISGMSITLAVIIKSSDRFDIFMGVLDALIVRLSTAMYPLAVLQASSPAYAVLATFNPLTYVTDLFRWGTAVTPLDNPLLPVLVVVMFFGFFTFLGVTIYDKQIEGGGWQ